MTRTQHFIKRSFDIGTALMGLTVLSLLLVAISLILRLTSQGPVFFIQPRVGRKGRLFTCIKFRSMHTLSDKSCSVTAATDNRITPFGRWLRRYKLDELPQLLNVLCGHMSFVGPRPDVPGFADKLKGEDRIILSVRPGITGPATIRFRDEEGILANQADPETYNRNVIFPEKVRINREYVKYYSFWKDLKYIWITLRPRR